VKQGGGTARLGGCLWLLLLCYPVFAGDQVTGHFKDYTNLKKRVYSFTKVEFVTEEGEFNDAICTLVIPDLKEESPPYVTIYYKRTNSQWFTESLYRKRLRFSFRDGVIKLDRSNFWDWYDLEEIRVVVIY
jgi:hypothetical protein